MQDAAPRSSDGQLLFLMEMVNKMKETDAGSRIASVHNGSSLFTGDAGSGESNIRRHIIENDWLEAIGQQTFTDFNQFRTRVDQHLKTAKLRLGASEKNAILNAVSWYDPQAEKVIRKTEKLSGEKLEKLLKHLGCTESQLGDFGYYPTDKAGEYLTYEPCSDLRDSESIPLKDHIHRYFVAEVKPHMAEAWINLDSTKIGYEISFNKYFYRHKPLRSMEAVAADIVALEQQAEGLIADILGLDIAEVSGVEHG